MDDKTLEKLNRTLERIEEKLDKQNSLGFNFIRGLVYGFGLLLGTTILVSLLITVISNFIDVVPFINSFFGIDPQTLQEVLNTQPIETN